MGTKRPRLEGREMSDGNIQAARTRLKRAVDRLCQPNHGYHGRTMVTAPSLYEQLCSDLAGMQGDNKTPAKSLPPIWIDAAQLKARIDTQTAKWNPTRTLDHWNPNRKSPTPDRLLGLAERTWRPQDTDTVNTMARAVDHWSDSIRNLLDPQSVKHITAACPSCGRQTVYRRDDAGELVRQPALRIVTNQGCSCAHCDAHWTPDKYMFLCKLLGFDLPEGVLE